MLENSPDWALVLSVAGPVFVIGWFFGWWLASQFNTGGRAGSNHEEEM